MRLPGWIVMGLATLGLVVGLSYAHEGHAETPSEKAPEVQVLDISVISPMETCVISGEKLGSHGKVVHVLVGDHLVKLCCQGCVRAVKKDPAAVIAKVDAAIAASAPATQPATQPSAKACASCAKCAKADCTDCAKDTCKCDGCGDCAKAACTTCATGHCAGCADCAKDGCADCSKDACQCAGCAQCTKS